VVNAWLYSRSGIFMVFNNVVLLKGTLAILHEISRANMCRYDLKLLLILRWVCSILRIIYNDFSATIGTDPTPAISSAADKVTSSCISHYRCPRSTQLIFIPPRSSTSRRARFLLVSSLPHDRNRNRNNALPWKAWMNPKELSSNWNWSSIKD
jgi:hypothetical protein